MASIWKLCNPLTRPGMVTDRSPAEKTSGKVTQPGPAPLGAFDTRTNDARSDVVPGAQLRVTDEQPGIADRLTVPNGVGVVVVVGGGVVVVVVLVGGGASSSVVVALRVRLDTLS